MIHRTALWVLLGALPLAANAAGLNHKYQPKPQNYPVPADNVLWVATDGKSAAQGATGSREKPFSTLKEAADRSQNGTTIIMKSGIYREPHVFITRDDITLQAEPQGEVWLKGTEVVPADRWQKEGSLWKTTSEQSFCRVCTTNADPKKEGMAAYPEQAFINDEPLKQVARKEDVKPGTFYVDDLNPTTLKDPKNENNRLGFNIPPAHPVTYYLGSDPTQGTAEISKYTRALTSTGKRFKMRGINVAQFSPHQFWGYKDPILAEMSGPIAISINGEGSLVENGIFAQNGSGAGAFFLDGPKEKGAAGAKNTVVRNNQFVDNGANGAGANYAHGSVFENNYFARNNNEKFIVKDCGAYCGVAHVKITHIEDFTFRNNTIDDSDSPPNYLRENLINNTAPGFWCDEGCINAKITGNIFINSPVAIFDEVSDGSIIASNIIEGGDYGIRASGSSNTRIYNNTISRVSRPFLIREDSRAKGCNYMENGVCKIEERWSKSRGLSWNQENTEIYNNIISSRAYVKNDYGNPYFAYPMRNESSLPEYDSGIVRNGNDMFRGLDYNAYYRSSLENEPYVIIWDTEKPGKVDEMLMRTADLAKNPRINPKINGLERHALDLFGSRAENPYFKKEAEGNDAYRQSNYHLRDDSPAKRSGKALPLDIARAIDPEGKTVRPGVAIDRGALLNVLMDATNGAESPRADKAQKTAPVAKQDSAPANRSGTYRSGDNNATTAATAAARAAAANNAYAGTLAANSRSSQSANATNNAAAASAAANRANAEPAAAGQPAAPRGLYLPNPKRPYYDRVLPYSEDRAAVQKDGRWGYIDRAEREVVAPTYQDAWSYREGRAAVKKNGRWGYLDNRGKEVVEPRYEQAMPYGEGRAAVKKDGQWGYLDEKGKEIVEPRYDRVWPYKNGRATVQKGGHRSVIDLNGNEILVP